MEKDSIGQFPDDDQINPNYVRKDRLVCNHGMMEVPVSCILLGCVISAARW